MPSVGCVHKPYIYVQRTTLYRKRTLILRRFGRGFLVLGPLPCTILYGEGDESLISFSTSCKTLRPFCAVRTLELSLIYYLRTNRSMPNGVPLVHEISSVGSQICQAEKPTQSSVVVYLYGKAHSLICGQLAVSAHKACS